MRVARVRIIKKLPPLRKHGCRMLGTHAFSNSSYKRLRLGYGPGTTFGPWHWKFHPLGLFTDALLIQSPWPGPGGELRAWKDAQCPKLVWLTLSFCADTPPTTDTINRLAATIEIKRFFMRRSFPPASRVFRYISPERPSSLRARHPVRFGHWLATQPLKRTIWTPRHSQCEDVRAGRACRR